MHKMNFKWALPVVAVLAVLVWFQNCSNLDQPSGTAGMNSLSPDDIILLSTPSDVTLYIGDTMNLYVQAESTRNLPLSFKWLKDGVVMSGRTTSTLNLVSVGNADGGKYTVVVSNSADSNSIDVNVTISPIPVITITTQPLPVTLDEGTAGSLSVVAAITPTQPLAYQWYKDNVIIAGATAASFNLGATGVARSGNYYVNVKTTLGPQQTVKSNTVKVTHRQLFNVDSATGCVSGFCACVTGGQPNVPDRPSALAICVFKGFTDVSAFTTRQSGPGPLHCNASGTSCFQNAAPSNLVCTTVTCIK